MKLSEVKVVLTEQDMLSIVYDYLDIEGIAIEDIKINEFIIIKGKYKKKLTIPFEAKIGLGNISGNIINMKLFNITVSKVGVFSGIRNIFLKKILKEFENYGIKVNKDVVTIDLDEVSKLVPYLYFKIKSIDMISGAFEVQAYDVIYSEKKPVVRLKKNCEVPPQIVSPSEKSYEPSPNNSEEESRESCGVSQNFQNSEESCVLSPKGKANTQDEYSKIRNKVVTKIPHKYEEIIEYAMLVPDIIALLWRLFRDKRVKLKVKLMVAGVIAYLASPIDIVVDFIPFVGKIDDVAIAFFGLNAILNEVPEEIILQNWQGEENIILVTKEAVSHISKVVGSKNVGILLSFMKTIIKKHRNNTRRKSN